MKEQILKKIKKLLTDKVYSYSVFESVDDKGRVYLSRLADKGEIVKVGRGRFYKPTNKTIFKPSQKQVVLDKSLFSRDILWSVRDGFKVDSDFLIDSYIKNYHEDDLMTLYTLFGYKRVLSRALKLYKSRNNSVYKEIKSNLQKYEQWRLDDKIDIQSA